nr:MAG TPA: hypothetical protein [Caudoviricetes sp.]DAN63481.1 MAG TPA: hypothetical protein [Caudoviricetes sp.]
MDIAYCNSLFLSDRKLLLFQQSLMIHCIPPFILNYIVRTTPN